MKEELPRYHNDEPVHAVHFHTSRESLIEKPQNAILAQLPARLRPQAHSDTVLSMPLRIRGGAGVLLFGVCCWAYASYSAYQTYEFTAGAVKATGMVTGVRSTRIRRVWVEIKMAGGGSYRTIPVRLSWLTLPGTYQKGDRVTILYDPHAEYDVWVHPHRTRVNSEFQLWGDSLLPGLVGLLAVSFYAVGVLMSGRSSPMGAVEVERRVL